MFFESSEVNNPISLPVAPSSGSITNKLTDRSHCSYLTFTTDTQPGSRVKSFQLRFPVETDFVDVSRSECYFVSIFIDGLVFCFIKKNRIILY